jgi:hypothetical protein
MQRIEGFFFGSPGKGNEIFQFGPFPMLWLLSIAHFRNMSLVTMRNHFQDCALSTDSFIIFLKALTWA